MKQQTKAIYGNESISSLKGADRVRKRPSVIFGSDGKEGCMHSVFEILSNSIDEAREGHGKKIILTKYLDNSIEIQDFGRGIPVDYNENEKVYNWELLFCELYAGGKYSKEDSDNYEFSLGLNGLGLCATQYSSEFMDVEVLRDGYKYNLKFEKGNNIDGLKKKISKEEVTTTKIKWRPDIDVFTDIEIEEEYFRNILKKQAIINKNIEFVFIKEDIDGKKEEIFLYHEGIKDYLSEIVKEDGINKNIYWEKEDIGKDREDKPSYKVKMSIAFCFSAKIQLSEYYHNSSFLEYGGSPEKAVKQGFISQIDNYIKQSNKYQKNESKITFIDIEDCLVLISSSFSTHTSYENQTKKSITNKFIYEAMTKFLKENLEIYFVENPVDANRIAEQVLINKRSRENAEKTRLNLKKKLSGNIDISNRIQKFVDCRSKNIDHREIFIVEGDSALGACKQARNSEFQAIIPVRGKILNCLKSEYTKIFNNDIITDIIKVLGCGVEISSKQNKDFSDFNIKLLRWNKVIICTDADVDGFQIRTLILTMIYRLIPSLIEKGFIYIAESPLFEINAKSGTYFAYTEQEKTDILIKIKDEKYTLQRSKGLGENEPDMMWTTTMNPKTRRVIKIAPEDVDKTETMFTTLLGDDIKSRKTFIIEKGQQYLNNVDLS
ncbi:MAG: DNA topoisomerase [Oscillospiraceae bacterium]|nr:DNA topoisomerase [Oscillospiraceae bacterium]